MLNLYQRQAMFYLTENTIQNGRLISGTYPRLGDLFGLPAGYSGIVGGQAVVDVDHLNRALKELTGHRLGELSESDREDFEEARVRFQEAGSVEAAWPSERRKQLRLPKAS